MSTNKKKIYQNFLNNNNNTNNNNTNNNTNKSTIWDTILGLEHLDIDISDNNFLDIKIKNQVFVSQMLEERMKIYENSEHKNIPANQPFIVRLDGNNFKKYTAAFDKPMDTNFAKIMIMTMNNLISKFNATTGYTHSDEISLVFDKVAADSNDSNIHQNHIYNGRISKICSIMAAYCSVVFNKLVINLINNNPESYSEEQRTFIGQSIPFFDARVVIFPKNRDMEIVNYFVWRSVMDCGRNCISTYAKYKLGAELIKNKKKNEMIEMMKSTGFNIDAEVPLFFRQGAYSKKIAVEQIGKNEKGEDVKYVRNRIINFTFRITYCEKYFNLIMKKIMNQSDCDNGDLHFLSK